VGPARAYWVYKGNPLEGYAAIGLNRNDLKRIEAARVKHLAFIDHIGQSRGISEFASVIARLEDIKDYEESERIAAKVAASLTAYVKKTAGQRAMTRHRHQRGRARATDRP
jgi:capsid protein